MKWPILTWPAAAPAGRYRARREITPRANHDAALTLAAMRRCACAFTLLEVVLALVIATGLMIVALYFYQQIGRLRNESVRKMHKLTTARLLMDKITSDLRSTCSLGYFESGFRGGADFIQFVKAEVPAMASWVDDVSTGRVPPESDLKRIGYTLVVSLDETNQAGSLMRWEEPNWPTLDSSTTAEGDDGEPFGADGLNGNTVARTESDQDSAPGLEAGSTVFTDHIQFLRFRYFDGAEWLTAWDGIGLPMGVEIQMSPTSWSEEDAERTEFPEELFRRVVYVPTNRADFESPEDSSWLDEVVPAGETNVLKLSPGERESGRSRLEARNSKLEAGLHSQSFQRVRPRVHEAWMGKGLTGNVVLDFPTGDCFELGISGFGFSSVVTVPQNASYYNGSRP